MRIDWLARAKTRILRLHRSRSRHFRGGVQRLEERALLSTFVVNSTDDAPDANLSDGIAADSQGHVTLRAAIQQASASSGADTITVPAGWGPARRTVLRRAATRAGLPQPHLVDTPAVRA